MQTHLPHICSPWFIISCSRLTEGTWNGDTAAHMRQCALSRAAHAADRAVRAIPPTSLYFSVPVESCAVVRDGRET